jgi:hypothetical protein
MHNFLSQLFESQAGVHFNFLRCRSRGLKSHYTFVFDSHVFPMTLQVRVFSPPPPNCRRFIVATNIAETSLTVDGVV